jgi:hypothetical protein
MVPMSAVEAVHSEKVMLELREAGPAPLARHRTRTRQMRLIPNLASYRWRKHYDGGF